MATDIRRARMRRIRPLGSVSPMAAAETKGVAEATNPQDEAPALPGFDVEAATPSRTAADRIALW